MVSAATGRRIALVATHHAEYAANLAMALARDHQVLLVLSRRNAARQLEPEAFETLRRALTLITVPHHYAPLQPLVAALSARAIRRFAPDIVHFQEHPTRASWWTARALGGALPIVTTVHDPLPHSGGDAAAASPYLDCYARLRAASDRLIVHGARLVPALARQLDDESARVRPVMIGPLRFGRIDSAVPPFAPAGPLLMFGRMQRYKGLDLLLDANDMLLARGIALPLAVAGEGPEIDRLGARMRAAPNILLDTGRLPQPVLAALVARSSAVVLPYHDATQSGVAASAFGYGRPVIATAVGALPDCVEHGTNGLLVPPGDAESLASAMARIVREPGLHARLTGGVARTVAERIGWRAIAGRTAQIYEEAIALGRP